MRWSATRYKLIVTNAEGQLLPPVTPSSQRCSLEQKGAEEFEELLASMVTCFHQGDLSIGSVMNP
jgi:hypothetical protein